MEGADFGLYVFFALLVFFKLTIDFAIDYQASHIHKDDYQFQGCKNTKNKRNKCRVVSSKNLINRLNI